MKLLPPVRPIPKWEAIAGGVCAVIILVWALLGGPLPW